MTPRYDQNGITIHEADYRETLKSCHDDFDDVDIGQPIGDADSAASR